MERAHGCASRARGTDLNNNFVRYDAPEGAGVTWEDLIGRGNAICAGI